MLKVRLFLFSLFGLSGLHSPTLATDFSVSGESVNSVISYRVQPEDTFYDIARRFDLGIVEVLAANPGIDPWLPPVGATLVLPSEHFLPPGPHSGIVINLFGNAALLLTETQSSGDLSSGYWSGRLADALGVNKNYGQAQQEGLIDPMLVGPKALRRSGDTT